MGSETSEDEWNSVLRKELASKLKGSFLHTGRLNGMRRNVPEQRKQRLHEQAAE